MFLLSRISPFNDHLKASMLEWTDNVCLIAVKHRRRVRNHVGSVHAGALFTLGETCAGLVIVRNFPFSAYRPLMSEVKVSYSKQAREDVVGRAEISLAEIERILQVIESGNVPFSEVITNILNEQDEIIAVVTTTWQIKKWDMVRSSRSL